MLTSPPEEFKRPGEEAYVCPLPLQTSGWPVEAKKVISGFPQETGSDVFMLFKAF